MRIFTTTYDDKIKKPGWTIQSRRDNFFVQARIHHLVRQSQSIFHTTDRLASDHRISVALLSYRSQSRNQQDTEHSQNASQDYRSTTGIGWDLQTDETHHYPDPHATEDHEILTRTYRQHDIAIFILLMNRTTTHHRRTKKATNYLLTLVTSTMRLFFLKPSAPLPLTGRVTPSSPTSDKPKQLMSHHHLNHKQRSNMMKQSQHHTTFMLLINWLLEQDHPPQTINHLSVNTTTLYQLRPPRTTFLKSAPLTVLSMPHNRFEATKQDTNC